MKSAPSAHDDAEVFQTPAGNISLYLLIIDNRTQTSLYNIVLFLSEFLLKNNLVSFLDQAFQIV